MLASPIATSVGLVPAHVGGLAEAAGPTSVPSWLTVATGGVLVGASFLFNSLLTDHEGVRAVNGWRVRLPLDGLRRAVDAPLSVGGVVGLAVVLLAAALGRPGPTNLATLVVWVGWWAGYAMSTYLLADTWPVVNPWRTLAGWLPSGDRSLPEWGVWPAVVGLLGLVWIEVVSPLATEPRALGALIAAYTVVTVAGARRYGVEPWFSRVDPVARVFELYGRLAPIQRSEDGLHLRLPGGALVERDPSTVPGSTAFVVALLWVTTFDGLVATPAWNGVARAALAPVDVATAGGRVAVWALYLGALLVGFAVFLGAFRAAASRARETVDSFLAPRAIERWFVPSLLPIAVGYHLAHFVGYVVALSPALAGALANPIGGPDVVRVAVLPPWFGTLQLALVVLGHLLAVWVAHALAMDLFPGAIRPIRSQYPFVVVMVGYTMASAWVIGQPTVTPAFL